MFTKLKQPSAIIFLLCLPIIVSIVYLTSMINFSDVQDNSRAWDGYPAPAQIEETLPSATQIELDTYNVKLRYDEIWPQQVTDIKIDLPQPLEVEYGQTYIVEFKATDPVEDLICPKP